MITVGIFDVAHSVSSNCSWTKQNKEVKVNCSGRDLSSVPKLNDSVTYLDLSHNRITNVSFDSSLKNLQFLDISWNHIRRIEISSFSSLTKLRFLDLSHCDISDVDEAIFGGLNALRYLNISYNREIGFASLPNTTYGLDKTKILKNLQFLDISWNHIRRIEISSFSSLTKLRFLDLSHCDIRDVDEAVFRGLNALRCLNISYNRELGFASLPNITYGLDKTKSLSLNLNAINCATGMGTILKIRHLRNIRNKYNRIVSYKQ